MTPTTAAVPEIAAGTAAPIAAPIASATASVTRSHAPSTPGGGRRRDADGGAGAHVVKTNRGANRQGGRKSVYGFGHRQTSLLPCQPSSLVHDPVIQKAAARSETPCMSPPSLDRLQKSSPRRANPGVSGTSERFARRRHGKVGDMPNPNAIVGTISRLDREAEHGAEAEFNDGRRVRIDPADRRATGFAEILEELRERGKPAYVEVDPQTGALSRLEIPRVTIVEEIRPTDAGDLEIILPLSQARHFLRRSSPDFDAWAAIS
jgi:hypothetical protein